MHRARGAVLDRRHHDWNGTLSSFTPFVTDLVAGVVSGCEEKLSIDTVVMDLRPLVDTFDALVIASGRNDRQVRAIAEEVERIVDERQGIKPYRVEGLSGGEWVALDYGDVIVHVFDEAARDYYDLEHLWSSAPATHYAPAR
jgi:ribosome-associated protein